jgi:hypothetical protein
MELETLKTRMLKPSEDQPNVILIILDSLNWEAWVKADPQNITKELGEVQKAHSPGCCTLPSLISYLSNYPPIGVGLGLFDKGIWVELESLPGRAQHSPTRAWMPRWYRDKGYHTSFFSGNAVVAEAEGDLGISKHFDHWGVMKYLKEDILRATPRVLEDFEKIVLTTDKPIFSVLWLFDTHYPYNDGRTIINPYFKDGYATRQAMVKALKYTDETVFPEIVAILRGTGRQSKVILTSDHGENHGGVGAGHNPFSRKLRMSDDLFAIPYIEGLVEP